MKPSNVAGVPRRAGLISRIWQGAAGIGVLPHRLATLEVRERVTGAPLRLPIVMVDYCGGRYLVAMLADGPAWAMSVRAAGGCGLLRHGAYEAVRLHEVPVVRRGPILRGCLQLARGVRPRIIAGKRAHLADFDAVAAWYPVFRVEPIHVPLDVARVDVRAQGL